ncbi:MAG TPA: UxaA family hydrolase [Casimicrobiaceae bacterium]|nr:UxaA family hydrolase [Casimicrobiaceae bacterium]
MSAAAVLLSDADNVATLLAPAKAGDDVVIDARTDEIRVRALEPIALGHKIALVDLAPGDRIVKYGECIGQATKAIARGAWVHVHNLRSVRAQAPAS